MGDYNDIGKGFLDDAIEETNVVDLAEEKQKRRRPFVTWTVRGNDHKLKLTAGYICKLEEKYRRNLLMLLTADDMPPISTMLDVIQAAMQPFNHGITYRNVQGLFDSYVEDGGDQTILMKDVIFPLLAVSGFFTPKQNESLLEAMEDIDI